MENVTIERINEVLRINYEILSDLISKGKNEFYYTELQLLGFNFVIHTSFTTSKNEAYKMFFIYDICYHRIDNKVIIEKN